MTEFADWRRESDDEADPVVATYLRTNSVDALENLLGNLFRWGRPGVNPQPVLPDEIKVFLASHPQPPDWFRRDEARSWARVARAQALYKKYQRPAMVVLGCASLPHCYEYGEVASALIMSGRLAAQVRIRLGETANFVDTVMAPGALGYADGKAGAGLVWARKVRLIHAVMRALIELDPAQAPPNVDERPDGRVGAALLRRRWVYGDSLRPINQLELALVLLTFSLVVVEGWRELTISLTDSEAEDYLFAWAFVGHLLGVRPELVERCMTLPEATKLFRDIKALQRQAHQEAEALLQGRPASWQPQSAQEEQAVETANAAEAGRLLAASLLVLLRDRAMHTRPGLDWITRSLAQSLVRTLAGEDTADELWVEPAPLTRRIIHWFAIKTGFVLRLGADMEETFRRNAPDILPAGDIPDLGLPILRGHSDKT